MDAPEACHKLLNEYFQRMQMTHGEFAIAIRYARAYVTNVLNGNEKISRAFLEKAVEAFAEHGVLRYRSEVRELFVLRGIHDIPPIFWTRSAFSKLKNDDPPESGGPKEQPQVPVMEHAENKPDTELDKPEEQPTSEDHKTLLVAQLSGKIDPEPSPQTLPVPPQQPKRPVSRRAWTIVFSGGLIVVLMAGSSFIKGTPLWGVFHNTSATLPNVSWGTLRAITCRDLFDPFHPPQLASAANCTPTSDVHGILSFNKARPQDGYPELDVKDSSGPSGPQYRVELRMDLSPTNGIPHIAGCVLMDTKPDTDVGEAVCVHNSGNIQVAVAATLCPGCTTKYLGNGGDVTINNPANVPVIVERVNNQLFIEVANQVIDPVTPTAGAGNIGFLAVGDQGSVKMTAIELT